MNDVSRTWFQTWAETQTLFPGQFRPAALEISAKDVSGSDAMTMVISALAELDPVAGWAWGDECGAKVFFSVGELPTDGHLFAAEVAADPENASVSRAIRHIGAGVWRITTVRELDPGTGAGIPSGAVDCLAEDGVSFLTISRAGRQAQSLRYCRYWLPADDELASRPVAARFTGFGGM